MTNDDITRQERREKKLRSKKSRMPKHGKGLARIYVQSITKRLVRKQK